MFARGSTHQLDATACGGEGHWPKTIRTRPRSRCVQLSQENIIAQLLVYLRRQSNTPLR